MSNVIVANELAPFITKNDKVVLFDGVCVLCSAWVDFLLKYDTQAKFKLASVQSSEGQALLKHYQQPLSHFTTMYVLEGDKLYIHSTAFIRVVARLGLPWSIVALSWFIPRPIRDLLYRVIARNRYRLFGKRQTCRMPNEAHKNRFLLFGKVI